MESFWETIKKYTSKRNKKFSPRRKSQGKYRKNLMKLNQFIYPLNK